MSPSSSWESCCATKCHQGTEDCLLAGSSHSTSSEWILSLVECLSLCVFLPWFCCCMYWSPVICCYVLSSILSSSPLSRSPPPFVHSLAYSIGLNLLTILMRDVLLWLVFCICILFILHDILVLVAVLSIHHTCSSFHKTHAWSECDARQVCVPHPRCLWWKWIKWYDFSGERERCWREVINLGMFSTWYTFVHGHK